MTHTGHACREIPGNIHGSSSTSEACASSGNGPAAGAWEDGMQIEETNIGFLVRRHHCTRCSSVLSAGSETVLPITMPRFISCAHVQLRHVFKGQVNTIASHRDEFALIISMRVDPDAFALLAQATS